MAKAKKKSKTISDQDLDLDQIMEGINKSYGVGAIMTFESGVIQDLPVVSTGSYKLDKALGVGGLPKGRIVEIYGPESSGKTTIALHVMANAQKEGGKCAIIDTEHALDPTYAENLGIDLNRLLVSQPDCGEDALGIAEDLIRTNSVDVLVIDSVAALVPRAELEGDMGDAHMGLQARLMGQALRKLTSIVKKTNTICIFINQIRMKIGVVFGSPETTSGGNALKFYASVRLDIRRTASEGEKGEQRSNQVRITVKKNKVAPPFRIAETTIRFGEGFDKIGELIDMCVEEGVINKKGSWYSYDDEHLGQGVEQVRAALLEKPDFVEALEEYILSDTITVGAEVVEEEPVQDRPKKKRRKKRRKKRNGKD